MRLSLSLIHIYSPLDAQFEPRLLRQMALRCHANGKQHHIGSDRVIARNMGDNAAINFLKTCHIGLEAQILSLIHISRSVSL